MVKDIKKKDGMYINFEQLMSVGLTMDDIGYLLMIRQKDPMMGIIPTDKMDMYIERKFVEIMKNGKYKITPRGGSALSLVETPGLTPEVEEIRDAAIRIYDSFGKDPGMIKEVERRMIWFVANTSFKKGPILDAVSSHLEGSGEYTMRLDNLIWKPSNVYSAHMSLCDSKLFDIILKRYGLNSDPYFKENKDKEISWLYGVARLPRPGKRMRAEYTISGDVTNDIKRIEELGKELGRRLKSAVGGEGRRS